MSDNYYGETAGTVRQPIVNFVPARDFEKELATLTAQRDEALTQLAEWKERCVVSDHDRDRLQGYIDDHYCVLIDGEPDPALASAQARAEKAEALLTRKKMDELQRDAFRSLDNTTMDNDAQMAAWLGMKRLRDAILREAGK